MNRFRDIDYIEDAYNTMFCLIQEIYQIGSVICVMAFANTKILIIIPFIVGYLGRIYTFTIRSYQELQRMNRVMTSPVESHMTEAINGNTTIRAFNKKSIYISTHHDDLNKKILANQFNLGS